MQSCGLFFLAQILRMQFSKSDQVWFREKEGLFPWENHPFFDKTAARLSRT